MDPYHDWLGIDSKNQRPNRYELLGLAPFENESQTIAAAFKRQYAVLTKYAAGPHGDLASQVIDEISNAYRCLTNDQEKRQYDADLRRAEEVGTVIQESTTSPEASSTTAKPSNDSPKPSPVKPPHGDAQLKQAEPLVGNSVPGKPPRVGAMISPGEGKKIPPVIADPPGEPTEPRDTALTTARKLVRRCKKAISSQLESYSINKKVVAMGAIGLVAMVTFAIMFLAGGGQGESSATENESLAGNESSSQSGNGNSSSATSPRPASLNGLTGRYYRGQEFEELLLERIDPNIHFLWDLDSPAEDLPHDDFSVRWEGYLKAPRIGTYTLSANPDNSMIVWLDDREILNVTGHQQSAEVSLSNQAHKIRVEYQESLRQANAVLLWSMPGFYAQQAIPTEALFPDKASADRSIMSENVMRFVTHNAGRSKSDDAVDLLAGMDPVGRTQRHLWWFDHDTLLSSRVYKVPHGPEKHSLISLPLELPSDEFRLNFVVERCVGDDELRLQLTDDQSTNQLGLFLDRFPQYKWRSLFTSKPKNSTKNGIALNPNQKHSVVIEVRNNGSKAFIDGELLLESNVSLADLRGKVTQLSLSTYSTIFRFYEISYEPLPDEEDDLLELLNTSSESSKSKGMSDTTDAEQLHQLIQQSEQAADMTFESRSEGKLILNKPPGIWAGRGHNFQRKEGIIVKVRGRLANFDPGNYSEAELKRCAWGIHVMFGNGRGFCILIKALDKLVVFPSLFSKDKDSDLSLPGRDLPGNKIGELQDITVVVWPDNTCDIYVNDTKYHSRAKIDYNSSYLTISPSLETKGHSLQTEIEQIQVWNIPAGVTMQ